MPEDPGYGGPKYYMMVRTPDKGISIFGFDDFTYDGVTYDNPARDLTQRLGGEVVEVDWDTVEGLDIQGPALGIGLDPSAKRAYINGTAFGRESKASEGPDAGEYACGHLYAKLLDNNDASLFVHVPPEPNSSDMTTIKKAISLVKNAGAEQKSWLPRRNLPWGEIPKY